MAARFRLRVLLVGFEDQAGVPKSIAKAVKGLRLPVSPSASVDVDAHPRLDGIERIESLQIDFASAANFDWTLAGIVASFAMPRWLESCKASYDLIIIDAPATSDRPEASCFASWAHQVLFVVRAGATSTEAAQGGLRLVRRAASLDPLKAPAIASVLT